MTLKHSRLVRLTHWINAVAMIIMITSGWRIYNASPVFDFSFPPAITLGGWLGGALLWHFAVMWVLVINWLVYIGYGFKAGHFRNTLLPITLSGIVRDFKLAIAGKLDHETGEYNFVQRFAYISVLAAILVTILSGIVIWKPTQFQVVGGLVGGYSGARMVHFLGMSAIVAFLAVHVVLVALVPRTLLPMITGGDRNSQAE